MKLLLPICLLAASQLLAAVPTAINYQGRLTDGDGNPASGTKTFSLKVFDAATGGNELYSETIGSVLVDENGIYNFQFGAGGTSTVSMSETIDITDGSGTSFGGTPNKMPLAGTLSVTDGTYSWNEVDGNPGAQANASATVVNGFVVGITVNDGGEAYTTPPTITITGDGSGATATASVTNGAVTSINVDNSGSGYTTATVTIEEPPAPFKVYFINGNITVLYALTPSDGVRISASYYVKDGSILGALTKYSSHWLEISVDGLAQSSREKLSSVPFAMVANSPILSPVGSVVAWLKSYPSTPSLPDGWLECNGQVINDPDSPYDGQATPALNGASNETKRFLRGSTASGSVGGSVSHYHTLPQNSSASAGGAAPRPASLQTDAKEHLPPYYEVVWIMRIK